MFLNFLVTFLLLTTNRALYWAVAGGKWRVRARRRPESVKSLLIIAHTLTSPIMTAEAIKSSYFYHQVPVFMKIILLLIITTFYYLCTKWGT